MTGQFNVWIVFVIILSWTYMINSVGRALVKRFSLNPFKIFKLITKYKQEGQQRSKFKLQDL